MKVCIDPGHGGNDKANRGSGGFIEADGVLDIAYKVRDILKDYPVTVVLTRDSDTTLGPKDRIAEANKARANIIVSIHTNVGPPEAHGVETYHSINSAKGKNGHKLATLIQKNMVLECSTYDRGVKTRKGNIGDYYYMIRETKSTAVIVECAFHTNPQEELLLKKDDFRWKCAQGISKGILAYFGLKWQATEQVTPIIEHPRATVEQAQEWAKKRGATNEFKNLAPLYWNLAPEHGKVDPAGAYAQAAKETGFGKFGGVIDASFHNPCGLKITKGGSNSDPAAHQRFNTWEEGVRAHLDHLALYSGALGYPRSDTFDPRHFPFLKGSALTFEELGGSWAPDSHYGKSIIWDYLIDLIGTEITVQSQNFKTLEAENKKIRAQLEATEAENERLRKLLEEICGTLKNEIEP